MNSPRLHSSVLSGLALLAAACGGEPKVDAKPSPSQANEVAMAPPVDLADQEVAPPDESGSEAGGDPQTDGEAPEPTADPVMDPPPAAEALTIHALAAYEVVTIYARPNLESTKLGYLRFGYRTMVGPHIEDRGEGCKKGWQAGVPDSFFHH